MTEMTTVHAADHHTAKHNRTWLHRARGTLALAASPLGDTLADPWI
jgi:hypothetical protein